MSATLRNVLDSLGPGIIDVLCAPAGLDVAVAHPVIDDPADPPPIDTGDLVLAVGTPAPTGAVLVQRAGGAGASGVIFRACAATPPALRSAAEDSGVALLGVVQPMAWSQLHTLLRTAAAASGGGAPEEGSAGPIGDLFSLANAIAATVGGPTTIEDPQSTVLAYSSLDEPIDEARRDTILGRRVPEELRRRLHEDGVFRRLWGEEDVVRVDYPGLRPRLAIGVRAGGEVLGSIWVAQDDRPLDAPALLEAARLAALHLIRARSSEDLERARRSNLLRSVLDGREATSILAEALGAPATSVVTVLAFRLPAAAATEIAVLTGRACRALDLYCESTRRRGSAVAMGPVVYLLLAGDKEPEEGRVEALAREVMGELLPDGTIAGIGSTLPGLASVPASRTEADRALAVLGTCAWPRPWAGIAEVRSHALLLRLRELAGSEPDLLSGRVQALAELESQGRAHHLETLRAYLDAFGDVNAASSSMGVHPNTFRYRLRRACEISGLHLGDPVERLIAHLQLHLR